MKTTTKLWLGIGILVLLSPLGLVIPQYFKAGDAWGEWGAGAFKGLIGYIPQGLEKLSGLWKPPLPDYAFAGWEEKGPVSLSISYIASALFGIVVVILIILSIAKLLSKKE